MNSKAGFERRTVLKALGAAGFTLTLPISSWGQSSGRPPAIAAQRTLAQPFLQIFKTLSGYTDIPAELSDSYFDAFSELYPDFPAKLLVLIEGLTLNSSASALQDYARSKQLGDFVQMLLTAWYTGTVGPNPANQVRVVAFQRAFMYRPTADGLPVPTYCFDRPLWFTALPPGITVEPKVGTVF